MFLLTLLFACATSFAQAPWIVASNKIAQEYALADGQNFPERASAMGYREFDGRAFHLEKDDEKEIAFLRTWIQRLNQEEAKAKDTNLRLDIRILRDKLRLQEETILLETKIGMVSFYPGTRFVLESLLQLVNGQSSKERKAAALLRFHEYVNGSQAHPPLLASFRNRYLSDEIRFQKKRVQPARPEVEQYLTESEAYLKGVRSALEATGLKGWEENFRRFSLQAQEYDSFVRTEVLSRAKRSFKLPREIYAQRLKSRGIEEQPEALIQAARAEYRKVFREFRAVAKLVAKAENLKVSEPAEVIRHLKQRQVLTPEQLKPLYERAGRTLEDIIRRYNLVSLPKEPLRIRIAGEAESLANPVPRLSDPPLVGNQGERPEFVIPSFSSGTAVLDDFSYEAAALVLTAHEGRPGHDLQFSTMLEQGTSIVRARYAFNSANVEGWGLYAEALVYPYLPISAQLVALQSRLIRVARAFLDPELQLGKIKAPQAESILLNELGLSYRLTSLELRRFRFDSPGQAPSYFYGLQRMEAAKRKLSSVLGANYSDRCFHDGVLALGMMPVGLIGEQLAQTLKCRKAQARIVR